MRVFDTGATRDNSDEKLDYEGFLSPSVLERFATYMQAHQMQADGHMRASDNWQKGIPVNEYMKSAWRHFITWWTLHRLQSEGSQHEIENAVCALMFNAMGYLHETLKQPQRKPDCQS